MSRLLCLAFLAALIVPALFPHSAASAATRKKKAAPRGAAPAAAPEPAVKKTSAAASARSRAAAPRSSAGGARQAQARKAAPAGASLRVPASAPARPRLRRRVYSPWSTPTYADSTLGDVADGEDPIVRRAAVEALGPYNGSVVVADPFTGRILAMVNQKLARSGAYQPCSTIKLVAAVAGLEEGIIDRETRLRLTRRESIDLTEALARSNNKFFFDIGEKLGFDRIYHYARLFGLGEKAGLDIEGESPGMLPEWKPKEVPCGMMTSFGEAISITPLQLTAMVSAIANGGSLYWLQHPRSQEEAGRIVPRLKRRIELAARFEEVLPGMMAAVDWGTGRRAAFDPSTPIFGKTGTCTDARTHLGWFASFNDVHGRKLVVTVLLTGGAPVNGPVAAGIAGQVYKALAEQQYLAQRQPYSPAALISGNAP
ncbi:MAG: penicillin-binding transpeptidase domain-containing protein [Bryobacteraceae bacterium]|nr:penicillin-binding transpeptidase domain-containing protein [Bryobacteraceae bacterium]